MSERTFETDNIDLSRAVTPGLTTVHVYKAWMGMIGVRHLVDRVHNPEQPKITTRVATQLVVRDSVAPYNSRPLGGSAK